MPLNSLSSVKAPKSSLARGHMGGGGDWGSPELGPGTPAMGSGVHIQEKSSSRRKSKYIHSGYNTQRSVDPPPQKGYPSAGAGGGDTGVKIQKIIGGSFLVLKP